MGACPTMSLSDNRLLEIARTVLDIESRAIAGLRLDEGFAAACRLCLDTPGRGDNMSARADQKFRDVRTDPAGCAGDQNLLACN